MAQPRHVQKRCIPPHRFDQALGSQCLAFRFQHRVEQARIGFASLQHTLAQRSQRLFLRQANEVLRELPHRLRIQCHRNALLTIHVRQHLHHSRQQVLRFRQAQLEGHDFGFQVGGQLHFRGGQDNRPSHRAELLCQIAQPPANLVVVAIPRKILQQENPIALNQRNIGDRLLRAVGVVQRRAMGLCQAGRHAPLIQPHAQVHRYVRKQRFHAIFFRRFHSDDRVPRIDEQPQLVVLIGLLGTRARRARRTCWHHWPHRRHRRSPRTFYLV